MAAGDTFPTPEDMDRFKAELRAELQAVARETVKENPLLPEPQGQAEQTTYYGRLGEMGHPEDRADGWPGANTGGDA